MQHLPSTLKVWACALTLGACATAGVLSGCDKGSTPESTDPETTPDEGGETAAAEPKKEEPGAPDVPWAEKTYKQRMTWMGVEVYPKMKELFQGYDPEYYASFSCETCHGDDAKDVKYAMPNAITPLAVDNPVEDGMGIDEKQTQFMMEQVVPTMAELLDTTPYDPEAQSGFGCLGCHLEG